MSARAAAPTDIDMYGAVVAECRELVRHLDSLDPVRHHAEALLDAIGSRRRVFASSRDVPADTATADLVKLLGGGPAWPSPPEPGRAARAARNRKECRRARRDREAYAAAE